MVTPNKGRILVCKRYAVLLTGVMILSFGLFNIHSQSKITEGGILGLTLFLKHWFHISPGISEFVLDLLCYLAGLRILGKSFLLRFLEKGKGKLLFVSSAASFGPAPYMSLYHATKAFVTYLVHGYHRELKRRKSSVSVSLLLPGPVDSGFAKAAGMTMRRKAMDPAKVARKAVDGLFAGRLEIVPGLWMKTVHLFSHFVPKRVITRLDDKSSEIER